MCVRIYVSVHIYIYTHTHTYVIALNKFNQKSTGPLRNKDNYQILFHEDRISDPL